MTPFGKPAAEVTVADIQRLIDDKVPEGRYLEYKSDIQVSKEQQKSLRKHDKEPVDRSWLEHRPLMDFGRDNLMEELVAFANADGGVLILGMIEVGRKPARADKLNPLPDIGGLERRLRDVVINCIEPPLPFPSVVAVATTESGDGVVILETEPSRLGPHRVRRTREVTIRREDSCVPMTMAEIHDMVIRNARRFDAVSASLEASSKRFQKTFVDTLLPQTPSVYIPPNADDRIDPWLINAGMAAFGLRVTLVPHDDLGIPRLEELTGLVPSPQSLRQGGNMQVPYSKAAWISEHGGRPVLGGVDQSFPSDSSVRSYRVKRDGFVEGTRISWGNQNAVPVECLVSMLACVLIVYDRLRERAGTPSMPAEVGIEVLTRGIPIVACVEYARGHTPLEPTTTFPFFSISDRDSMSQVINAVAGDLANASGLTVDVLPTFQIVW
jgi:hypothetical protein